MYENRDLNPEDVKLVPFLSRSEESLCSWENETRAESVKWLQNDIPKCCRWLSLSPMKMPVLSVSISPSRSKDWRSGQVSRMASVPMSVRKLRPSRLRVCVGEGGGGNERERGRERERREEGGRRKKEEEEG